MVLEEMGMNEAGCGNRMGTRTGSFYHLSHPEQIPPNQPKIMLPKSNHFFVRMLELLCEDMEEIGRGKK